MTKFICSNIMYLFCFSSWNGNCSMLISTYQWTYSLHVLCITYVCTTCTVHIRSFQLQVLLKAQFKYTCQKTSWDSHLPQSLLLFYLRIFLIWFDLIMWKGKNVDILSTELYCSKLCLLIHYTSNCIIILTCLSAEFILYNTLLRILPSSNNLFMN